MKLVTTYSALHLLGPAFTFRTEVLADGPVAGDVLRGELYVRGGGDPHLVIENLWQLANRAARLRHPRHPRRPGARQDASSSRCAHDPGQFDGEEGRAYNVGPDALLVNFKSIAVTFVPGHGRARGAGHGGARSRGHEIPAHACPPSRAAAATGAARLRADINDPMNIRIGGAYPLACGERAIYLGALDHTNYFGAVFRALWERQGGAWTGKVREGDGARHGAAGRRAGIARRSRCSSATSTSSRNNVMTQQLFLTMGAAGGEPGNAARGARRGARPAGGARHRGARADPRKRLRPVAHRTHLGRHAGATCSRDAWKSQWMSELMASLPISGVDGTMQRATCRPAAAHMKTGMLEDTRAVAGYVLAASGRRYVVVAIINHPNARSRTGCARCAAGVGVSDGLSSAAGPVRTSIGVPYNCTHVCHTFTRTGHGTHGLSWLGKNHAAEPHPLGETRQAHRGHRE